MVLVRDSGGVAMLLDHFLLTYKDQGSLFYKKGEILPQFEKAFGPKRENLTKIAELDMRENKVSSFALTETATAELDLHLLNAVIYDVNQVRPELRLRLAVEWNRKDVVERVLRMSEEKSDMRGALQCAVATAPQRDSPLPLPGSRPHSVPSTSPRRRSPCCCPPHPPAP